MIGLCVVIIVLVLQAAANGVVGIEHAQAGRWRRACWCWSCAASGVAGAFAVMAFL